MFLTDYANPSRFLALVAWLLPWMIWISALLIFVVLYCAFFVAPPDYQQGESVRIMFLHVPSAWLGMLAWVIMSISALGTLVWRHPLADVSAKAMAPLGASFTFLGLVTGALWGRPMWGTYWVWDGRLTSFLILFLMYLGVMVLWQAIEDFGKAARAVALLTLVGAINLPIIKFSVDWWETLHQPASVLRLDGPGIHPSLLVPLLVCAFSFSFLLVTFHLAAMRNEILRRKLRTMRLLAAQRHS